MTNESSPHIYDEPSEFVLAVWKDLQRRIKKETSPYLSRDRFVLQHDAFVRLSDEYPEPDVPFLNYEYLEVNSDDDFEFSLHFFLYGFILKLGPAEMEFPYTQYALSIEQQRTLDERGVMHEAKPERAAENILTTIKMLLAGQIVSASSSNGVKELAVENYILGYEPHPIAFSVIGNFGRFNSKSTAYRIRQNHALRDRVAVPDYFPLLPPVVDGRRVQRGRVLQAIGDTPPQLTKATYNELTTNIALHEFMGKMPETAFWSHFYSSSLFWLVTITIGVPVYVLYNLPQLHLKSDTLSGIFPSITAFIIMIVAFRLTGQRQAKIDAGESPLTYRIDRALQAFGIMRWVIVVTHIIFFAVIGFGRFWLLKGQDSGLQAGYQLLTQVPLIAGVLVIDMAAIALAVSPWYRTQFGRVVTISLTAAAPVLGVLINVVSMNTSDSVEQPATWLFTIWALASIIMLATGGVGLFGTKKDIQTGVK